MLVFGLTGGIASGKSTVAAHWREQGLNVIDADAVARLVTHSVKNDIVARFGTSVLDCNGDLDRKALGKIVFDNEHSRRDLNAIIHPLVQEHVNVELKKLKDEGCSIVCYDVPLLYESGLDNTYSPVVVVSADHQTQLMRLMQRNSLSEHDAEKRIQAQVPMTFKVNRADYVINNDGSLKQLYEQADIVLKTLKGYKRVDSRH